MRSAFALAAATALLVSTSGFAQDATPEGTWVDAWGTSVEIAYCGDGTQVCATLLDIQGDSRTEENLAYVGQQIMQGTQTAANEWEGTVVFQGVEADGTLTLTGADTLDIRGCTALILCNTLSFQRS